MKAFITAALLTASLGAAAADIVSVGAAQRAALGIAVAPAVAVERGLGAYLPARVTVPNAQLQVIAAPQDGLIEALLVTEGEAVRQGQTVARIRSPRLVELQGEYLELQAAFALADSNQRRDRQLFADGIIAERRLQETRAAYRQAAGALARVRQLLTLTGFDSAALERLRTHGELSAGLPVSAPSDGIILQQMATPGARVAAADPLYQLARLDPLWLEIHVPLAQAAGLHAGQTVRVREPQLAGRIVAVGRAVHGTDQGVLIRAEVSAGADRLHPGQFVQAQIESGDGGAGFRVPRSAVVRVQERAYVFVATADGFEPVEVRVVAEESAHLLVQGGLQPGSGIAVAGVAALKAAWLGAGE